MEWNIQASIPAPLTRMYGVVDAQYAKRALYQMS